MHTNIFRAAILATATAIFTAPNSLAVEFDFSVADYDIDAVMNNTVTLGASWRIEERSDDLVGKSNLNPSVCSGPYQSCQGLHRLQNFPAQRLASAPGMASINFDDGNLNYDKGDITQAPFKLSQDLTLSFGDYGCCRALKTDQLCSLKIDQGWRPRA